MAVLPPSRMLLRTPCEALKVPQEHRFACCTLDTTAWRPCQGSLAQLHIYVLASCARDAVSSQTVIARIGSVEQCLG
jgi:hypothetical protein